MFQRRLLPMAACLLLVAALGSSQANAQFETWSGTCSFTVKITNEDGPDGNKKFVTKSGTESGTVEMYIGSDGPTKSSEGYYLKFIASDGTIIGITEMVGIRTQVTKSKSDKLLGIGIGPHFNQGSPDPTGLAYLDASGTIKKDKTGHDTSISLTMKLAGGTDDGYVWNCSPKVTLTKKNP